MNVETDKVSTIQTELDQEKANVATIKAELVKEKATLEDLKTEFQMEKTALIDHEISCHNSFERLVYIFSLYLCTNVFSQFSKYFPLSLNRRRFSFLTYKLVKTY